MKQIVVYVLKDSNLKRNIERRIHESKDISTIQKTTQVYCLVSYITEFLKKNKCVNSHIL